MTKEEMQPKPRACVVDVHLDTAEALLDALSPRNQRWAIDRPGYSWIFRGQADAGWWLKARAVRALLEFDRAGIKLDPRPGWDPSDFPAWEIRDALIHRMLSAFRRGLDRSGLVIPVPSPRIDSREKNETIRGPEPLREAFPLMALAQHHGLPTLLLDWSRRSWVAAYFAAVEAADHERRGSATHLAVWALVRPPIDDAVEGPFFYEAPGGTNPNLAAQAGLFTMHFAEGDPSLEEHFAGIKLVTGGSLPLRRLTLPVTEARKLLRLLADEGITGAAMFPGADGVVRGMREARLWDTWPDEGEVGLAL